MSSRQQECSICLDSFKNPKFLPCHHSFCYKCLEDYVRVNLRNGKFNCPMCKRSAELPSEGVQAFQTNFYVVSNETERRLGPSVNCSKHPGQDIQLVCQTCNVCMCLTCKAFDHDTHPSKPIAKVAAEVKENLRVKQRLCDQKLKNLNAFVQNGNSLEKRLNEEEQREIEAIENQYSKLLSILDQEVTQMKEKVRSQYEKVRKQNAVIMKKVLDETAFYTSARKDANTLIDQGTDIETVKQGSELDRRIAKQPSTTDQVSLKNPGKKFYKPAEIKVGTLTALIGTTQQEDEDRKKKEREERPRKEREEREKKEREEKQIHAYRLSEVWSACPDEMIKKWMCSKCQGWSDCNYSCGFQCQCGQKK